MFKALWINSVMVNLCRLHSRHLCPALSLSWTLGDILYPT